MATIIGRISLSDGPHEGHKETEAPVNRSATGYGRKIPTRYMVKLRGRWRRVYVCQISNAGTAYIPQGNDWIVVDE